MKRSTKYFVTGGVYLAITGGLIYWSLRDPGWITVSACCMSVGTAMAFLVAFDARDLEMHVEMRKDLSSDDPYA